MIVLSSQLSTWENGSYATVSGTSMACPHVSGVVALMLSANPSATPAQIYSALTSSSENPSTTGSDSNIGYGVITRLYQVTPIATILLLKSIITSRAISMTTLVMGALSVIQIVLSLL